MLSLMTTLIYRKFPELIDKFVKKQMSTPKITIKSNGSMKVEGGFEIVDEQGNAYDLGGREVISLCRCGLSTNMPFCDGSHKGKFEHQAKAFALPPKKTEG